MIRLTIQRKVFLATFALATTMVVLLGLVMRWNLGQGFERYTSAAEFARLDWLVRNLETEYAVRSNWDFLRAEPQRAWRRLTRPNQDAAGPNLPGELRPGVERGFPPPPARDQYPLPRLRDEPAPPPGDADLRQPPAPERLVGADILRIAPRLALLDVDGTRLAGNVDDRGVSAERPITHQGKTVGRLTLQAAPSSVRELDAAFLASQTRNMFVAGLAALLLSLLAAWLLARHLLEPIHDLTDGARRIADGRLDACIPIRQDDELGELAYAFNAMAERLARIEESRRAWISDTSHELRTPLAVLRAEIEAMQDEVRQPDAATLARLHKQVAQLATLVDDLRLTLDREPGVGDMAQELFAPLEVLRDTLADYGERYAAAGIALDVSGLDGIEPWMRGDAGRLTQVFANLLENTLRYTDRGGRLRISARIEAARLALQFDDTAPAPPRPALPHLFERFFRAEASRSRALGGSGLGLAICKALMEAQGGCITASLSELGGLAIRVELPLEKS